MISPICSNGRGRFMRKKRIGIIGHFGGDKEFFDGQTVKTKVLYEELKNATHQEIRFVDTYYKMKPVRLLIKTIWCLLTCTDVIVILGWSGLRQLFPIFYIFNKLFGTRIYHDVLGGRLDSFVKEHPKYAKYFNACTVTWVETGKMVTKLETVGVHNAEVLPNFKRLKCVAADEIDFAAALEQPYKFCTFSRVMKEKGIEDAIDAIEKINAAAGARLCTLDIYGQIAGDYVERFEEIMSGTTDAVKYAGIIPFEESVQVISKYFALLFPTYYVAEGMAGTIIDALSAAVPVIATDWNYNSELVDNGRTGIIYPNNNCNNLMEAICWAIDNAEIMRTMRFACIEEAKKYSPQNVVAVILGKIGQ